MIRVGVLAGGPSSEHDVSLMTGANIIRALKGRCTAVPIFVSKNGTWLVGEKKEWMSPADAVQQVDVVFNAMHGEYGEDGQVQRILDCFNIPYTGSRALASAITMNKQLSGEILRKEGLRLPRTLVCDKSGLDVREVINMAPAPWFVKPMSRGSSVGITKAKHKDALESAYKNALAYDPKVMVQEYIPGREVTCAVLENFNGQDLCALAPIEIVPPEDADFFDYNVKYNGRTRKICPAEFYGAMLSQIQDAALIAHKALGLRHYSRTDMIVKTPDKTRKAPEIYVLEVNTLPGLTVESLMPKAARHAGLDFPDLVMHLINQAAGI